MSETTTRSYEVYSEVKRRILDLRMPPGSEFTEGELVDDLGVSKTPVREALARLRQENLVVAVPRSGYRVTPVTVKDARDLMALRTLLEGEAAALAAQRGADSERLKKLDELCNMSYDASSRESVVSFLQVNRDFHLAVAELSGNERLAEMLIGVLEQLQRVMHLGLALTERSEEIVHEHRDLLDAILGGDPERARKAAVDQAHSAQTMILTALLSSDAVLSANLGVANG